MVGREPDRARIVGEVVQAQRTRVADQHAENSPAAREIPDRRMGLGVDAGREEALELLAGPVDDPERGVARPGQLGRGPDKTLEQCLERELGGERKSSIEECPQPVLTGRYRLHESRAYTQACGKTVASLRLSPDARSPPREPRCRHYEGRTSCSGRSCGQRTVRRTPTARCRLQRS